METETEGHVVIDMKKTSGETLQTFLLLVNWWSTWAETDPVDEDTENSFIFY